ncbi:unnamed protein product [Rotaria socialis]|uniref:Uncharacterized protein n=1 Tax=Rotaria socialis TaxID=392032 RepID=A0A820FDK6_9BILA|nr:unnamed protein product [Rotaria socialis]CAF3440557.1 unnamed protein product [Rotaria socialis]CAF3460211.1 unnamed protein product [Rotaria socialis]CAF3554579.1 unnamed protein product [Rotaria socialis]CAF3557282.1 unnamed protein product [Rotaria socialis]
MLTISKVIFLIIISVCHGIPTTDRECSPDTIDFDTKVAKSSIVVYGKAMAKILDEENDSTFHVFFQVYCILKGPATLRQINITSAGHVEGKEYCQEFPVGHGYSIAFLEPLSANITDNKTFIPADFVEIHTDGASMNQLLARTCNLVQTVPIRSSASVSEVCPAVSTDPVCQKTTTVITAVATNYTANTTDNILSKETSIRTNETLSTPNENEFLLQPIHFAQHEIIIIRGKSDSTQIDVDKKNAAKSVTYSILLTIVAIFYCFS